MAADWNSTIGSARRIALAATLSLGFSLASAQYASKLAEAARNAPAGRACGSVVFLQCPRRADLGEARAAPLQWQATRWAESAGDDQIVITSDRIRRNDTMGTVFQRHLGSGGSGSEATSTTDKGAGVRCTVMRTGKIYCSRAADETPGIVGVQTDWSDWSF